MSSARASQSFVEKWDKVTVNEKASAQEHFVDLCRLLGQSTPVEADPGGTWYRFEKSLTKAGGGDVFAAYGWPADLDDNAILERLLRLNAERA